MLLSKNMWAALNTQVQREFDAAYLYLAMASYFNDKSLPGFAQWMKVQAKEEIEHAMKLYDYIEERGNKVELLAIPAPKKEYEDAWEAMETALGHEQMVTKFINEIMDMAIAEKDHATVALLQWFVTEQVEEEDNAQQILDKLSFIKKESSGLLYLDHKLGKRDD